MMVNAFQTKERRREKYRILRETGVPVEIARRARDFRDYYFNKVLEFYRNNPHFGDKSRRKN